MTGSETVAVALANALSRPDSFVGRVLSPLVDGADYLSDKIRFARWKASLDTLEKANEIAKARGVQTGDLSIRFLAPWLEGASLQPDDADDLTDLWARLFVGATQGLSPEDLVFVDVLRKIGEKEARLIRWLGEKMTSESIEDYLYSAYERDFSEPLEKIVTSMAREKLVEAAFADEESTAIAKAAAIFKQHADKYAIYPEAFGISMSAHFSFSESFIHPYDPQCDGVSFDVLKYLGLVSEEGAKVWLNIETDELLHFLPNDDGNEEWWHWSVSAVAPTSKVSDVLVGGASFPADLPAITQLFRAYAASLPIDLGYQGFDGELASLPGKYAPPQGALLIARDASGAALGCVAMRPLHSLEREASLVCEMKRLYVAPEGRGLGLGKHLACAIIEAARAAGYHEMRLDTLASMHAAQALYRALGFVEIPAYYDSPIENTVFMLLKLD